MTKKQMIKKSCRVVKDIKSWRRITTLHESTYRDILTVFYGVFLTMTS